MSASSCRTRPSLTVRVSLLPVWAEGMKNFLDVLRPASNDEVSKNMHFWIVNKGLLESSLAIWCYVGMMDSNIQWKVGAWPGTESTVHVWYNHFLTWMVMDCEVISL